MPAGQLVRDYSRVATPKRMDPVDAVQRLFDRDLRERNTFNVPCPVHNEQHGEALGFTLKPDGQVLIQCASAKCTNGFIGRFNDWAAGQGIDPDTWRRPSRHRGEAIAYVKPDPRYWQEQTNKTTLASLQRLADEREGVSVEALQDLGVVKNGVGYLYPIKDGDELVDYRRIVRADGKWREIARKGGRMRLVAPWYLDLSEPTWFCAGVWDGLAASDVGKQVVWTTGEGWVPPREELARFDGAEVVVAYDNDQAGQQGGAKVAEALRAVGARVRVVVWPAGTEGMDLRDWINDQGDPEELVSTGSLFDLEVEKRLERLRVEEEARRRLKAEHRTTKPAPVVRLGDDFLAEPDEDTEWLVEGLWPSDANIIFAAQAKAGKTTTTLNLVRALCDGGTFFEAEVRPLRGRVFLLDNELGDNRLRRWLRRMNISNADRFAAVSLRGNASAFDITDPVVRTEWAERIRATGAEVLILDCLRPILNALGLDEHTGVGPFLAAFDELLAEAGVTESLIVHHAGHNGARSQGDSRLRQWPDVEWLMTRNEDNDERTFRAYGRDVDVERFYVEYDEARHEVVRGNEVPPPVKKERGPTSEGKVREVFVGDEDRWFSEAEVVTDTGLSQSTVNAKVKHLVGSGFIVRGGDRGHYRYRYHAGKGDLPQDVTGPGKSPVKQRSKQRLRR